MSCANAARRDGLSDGLASRLSSSESRTARPVVAPCRAYCVSCTVKDHPIAVSFVDGCVKDEAKMSSRPACRRVAGVPFDYRPYKTLLAILRIEKSSFHDTHTTRPGSRTVFDTNLQHELPASYHVLYEGNYPCVTSRTHRGGGHTATPARPVMHNRVSAIVDPAARVQRWPRHPPPVRAGHAGRQEMRWDGDVEALELQRRDRGGDLVDGAW